MITNEAFFEDEVPCEAAIPREPSKLRSRIYLNAAKEAIVPIVDEARLTDGVIVEPGAT